MKTHLIKISLVFLVICQIFLGSCSSDDDSSVANQVFANTTSGLILRTISINQGTFDFTNTASEWSVTLEAQDTNGGRSLKEIKVYATFVSAAGSSAEAFVKTVPSSVFSAGPDGYPRGDVDVSLAETLAALNLSTGQYVASDKFELRLEAILKDGRIFTVENSADTVTGGSYFSSPFQYSSQFFCPLTDASLFQGTYTVVADAWADYSAGDTVPVVYVPSDGPYTFRILSTNNPFIANTATAYMLVTVDPADGTVTVASNQSFDYGVPIDVVGTGTVGTCTGDINLTLEFVGYATDQTFILTKN